MKQHSVLVVDDIDSIRFAIKDYLQSDYEVFDASSGKKAMDLVESENIDMVLTDIRMPGMGGLELIRLLAGKYPHIKHALITAYNVDDYIQYARKKKIWNIIPKTSFLDLRYIKIMIRKLLTNDIFGIEKYFPEMKTERIRFPTIHTMVKSPFRQEFHRDVCYTLRISSFEEMESICDKAAQLLMENGAPSVIRLMLEELVNNAVVWGPEKAKENSDGKKFVETSLPKQKKLQMKPNDSFELSFGILENNAMLSVLDFHGSLDREEILYRLERQVTLDPQTQLPIGLNDAHGRGLFISRENTDHLIFNIEPHVKTEVIGILSLEGKVRNRAISIYQKEALNAPR